MLGYVPILLLSSVTLILAQFTPGQCPNARYINLCAFTCFHDGHCRGSSICCRTSCGGLVCVPPISVTPTPTVFTARTLPTPTPTPPPPPSPPEPVGKQGSCPQKPTGPWICSSTCSKDNHCRGAKKCCKTRCGGSICTTPELN